MNDQVHLLGFAELAGGFLPGIAPTRPVMRPRGNGRPCNLGQHRPCPLNAACAWA